MRTCLKQNHKSLASLAMLCLLVSTGCAPAEQPPATPPRLPPVPPRPAGGGGPQSERYKQMMGGKDSPYSAGKPAGGNTK